MSSTPCASLSASTCHLLLFVGPGLQPAPELVSAMARAGWRCLWLLHAEAAVNATAHARFDAVVVQAEASGGPPGRQLESLRAVLDCPLLVAAEAADEIDEIIALEMGADGYLAGVLAPRRLRAHLSALQRRRDVGDSGATDGSAVPRVSIAGWTLDTDSLRLDNGHHGVSLTAVQVALLQVLAAEPGRVVSRAALSHALGPHKALHVRSVDVYVARLRRRLREQRVDGLQIDCARGRGYVLSVRVEEEAAVLPFPWLPTWPHVRAAARA